MTGAVAVIAIDAALVALLFVELSLRVIAARRSGRVSTAAT